MPTVIRGKLLKESGEFYLSGIILLLNISRETYETTYLHLQFYMG